MPGKAWAYYNDSDKFVCAWLRELIKAGLIADGEVDERSITEVQPEDVRGFTQCHWFAGIGAWSYALRLAGVRDDDAVWTGSCPCQGYSAAGKQKGAADTRNLWPSWFRLIRECRPVRIFGEQVENAVGHGWLDAVSTDLEAEDYTIGAAVLGAHSVGAPHIRQRLWFVAESERAERWTRPVHRTNDLYEVESRPKGSSGAGERREPSELAESEPQRDRSGPSRAIGRIESANGGIVGNAESSDREVSVCVGRSLQDSPQSGRTSGVDELGDTGIARSQGRIIGWHGTDQCAPRPSGVAGFWSDCDWIFCRDGKWRPVEPGTFPLVTGAPARVGRLRGYGNAINPHVAAAFIKAYREIRS